MALLAMAKQVHPDKILVTLWQLNNLRLIMKSGKDLEDGLQLV
ncbi:hypothetical protein CK203_078369 [Vitis vinifera]|uniref:Uncharacterized protein n=1 Tax=Vitis vinifera TaxID=29760 RepID=A0A438DXS8_VITVI|nr:hypothetical protein CK203_078369 [Vitis vinifera]